MYARTGASPSALAICGLPPERSLGADPAALVRVAHGKFAPFQVLLRGAAEGPAEAQICEDFVCRIPVRDPGELASQVE